MSLILLIGGARSGKSRLAVELAAAAGAPVVVVATAEARDDEMAARIARHRRERPAEWRTVEEPVGVGDALVAVEPDAAVVLDCLTLWVANLLEHQPAEKVIADARAVAAVAASRPGVTIAVTNEVGAGIVPETMLGRVFRDVLGEVNAGWADAAAQSFFVVAGRMLELSRP
jgi:adenosylcobinamide kinase / adenosylcobinamide-phosphate guanylyltransferase